MTTDQDKVISFGKDERGQTIMANLVDRMGIDRLNQTLGCQLISQGRTGIIAVLFKPEVVIDKYCKDIVYDVTEGVVTKNIRPAGRPEVIVTVSDLSYETPDGLIFEYLEKFGGRIVDPEVIVDRYRTGPWKGQLSGDRKYLVDMTNAKRNMGTFHNINDQKIKISFKGMCKMPRNTIKMPRRRLIIQVR